MSIAKEKRTCPMCKEEFIIEMDDCFKRSYYDNTFCSDGCGSANFWLEKVEEKDNPNSVRVDGTHFWIGDEDSKSGFRGHGGAKFIIVFSDGREVITTNLWCQGDIPLNYRKKVLHDNAEFKKFSVNEKEEVKCPTCNSIFNPQKDLRNQLSIDEYRISGMCQNCQDNVFGAD
ncbi:hypothetical protein SDC9_07477 [bioreactor metagenome]|uniref:Uncharacterized protein n=1 Tax=bioreactor metagenome TaxID=1076179 RepID=A0A644T4M7_9ZZZZ|nr:hypothetical protein [Methanobrevibacter sp.]MEA4956931.1 hypothetical protein [Methanobrevibacter sp.]